MSRLKILTDAPSGIQSPIETYLSMINSHLEFLCANGLLLRLGYIMLWGGHTFSIISEF